MEYCENSHGRCRSWEKVSNARWWSGYLSQRGLNPICRIAVCTKDEKPTMSSLKIFYQVLEWHHSTTNLCRIFIFYKNKLEQDSCLLMSLTYQMLSWSCFELIKCCAQYLDGCHPLSKVVGCSTDVSNTLLFVTLRSPVHWTWRPSHSRSWWRDTPTL